MELAVHAETKKSIQIGISQNSGRFSLGGTDYMFRLEPLYSQADQSYSVAATLLTSVLKVSVFRQWSAHFLTGWGLYVGTALWHHTWGPVSPRWTRPPPSGSDSVTHKAHSSVNHESYWSPPREPRTTGITDHRLTRQCDSDQVIMLFSQLHTDIHECIHAGTGCWCAPDMFIWLKIS